MVGIVGNDVPRQLVLAAGALPVRLTGTWEGAVDAEARDLLGAADVAAVHMLSEIRADPARFAGLIVCNDSQAHLRLFYVLRATMPQLRTHLLDLPREDSPPTRTFVRHQLAELLEFCESVTGSRADAAALAAAAAAERGVGDALARLTERRRTIPPTCSGAAALAAQLHAARCAPEDAARLLDAAGASDPAAPSLDGVRVHLTGSNHPDATVYRAIEADGITIVSDDHDTGDDAWIGVAVDGTNAQQVIDALVAAHFARVTNSATALSARRAQRTRQIVVESRAQVVGAFIRELDDAPRWDLADQAAALDEIGIALQVRSGVRDPVLPAAAALAAALRLGTDAG